jgi:hypothetical protein
MKNFLIIIFFFITTFVFTGYIILNTWEILTNTDLPIARAVEKSNLNPVINYLTSDFGTKLDTRYIDSNAKLDELAYLDIPALKTRLYLEEARKINDDWYIRPTLGGYIGLNTDTRGNTIDYLVFTKKSWSLIPYTDELELGTAATMYTRKGYKTNFEISEKHIKQYDEKNVIAKSDKRQLVLLIDDADNRLYYVYSLVLER